MKRRDFLMVFGGAFLISSIAARAQQSRRVYRVGFLSPGGFAPGTNPAELGDAIAHHLLRVGFRPGQNLEFIKRGAEGKFERLPALVQELISAKVDVILTFSYPVAVKAKEGTSSIPIVMFNSGDPVKTRLVTSLNQPGRQHHRHLGCGRRTCAEAS
jgi:putative tryptophan/tyrosine transport system substrate-binding protein